MRKIGIIGGGFSGTMFAVHLIQNAKQPFELVLINESGNFNKGIAYNPYSKKSLLNVLTSKMSAFPEQPDHFLDWVMKQSEYQSKDRSLVGNSFLPRYLYGEYLTDIWKSTTEKLDKTKIRIQVIDSSVSDLDHQKNFIQLVLSNGETLMVDRCVIASGNNVPRNPNITNTDFFKSENYFQNPWDILSVCNVDPSKPVLIIGNGLTMVDTVLGLQENGFKGEIISVSPNGFNILPHRHNGFKYTAFVDELKENASLRDIVKLINKHIKLVREFGLSAEPIIDSLRPYTQKIWQRLSSDEKKLFMSRFRHLWGVARHRIPLHVHDKLQQLRIDKKLFIYSGKLLDIKEETSGIEVRFFDKKDKVERKVEVSRVINCTGPDTDLQNLEKSFLKNCLQRGIITQDELKLGIQADPMTFEVFDKSGNPNSNLYTLGGNLKGVLWESTAVNELRDQAQRLAIQLLKD